MPVTRSPPVRRPSLDDVDEIGASTVTTNVTTRGAGKKKQASTTTTAADFDRPSTSQSTRERNSALEDMVIARDAEIRSLKESFASQLAKMQADIAALSTRPHDPPAAPTQVPEVTVHVSPDNAYSHHPRATVAHQNQAPIRPTPHYPGVHDPEIVGSAQARSARRTFHGAAMLPEATRAQSLRPEQPLPFAARQNPVYSGYVPTELRSPFVPLDQEPVRRGSETMRREPALKAQDIGYWDPSADDESDDYSSSSKALRIPVELFVKRLYRLAGRHGEQQVLDQLDSALVNVSSWLMTFSREEDMLTGTLDGWCQLLIRDFGEPEVVSRQKMKDYDYTHASNAREFWTNKLAKLRISGVDREHDQYHEIWLSLPARWRENISMYGSLAELKSDIRQKETATGWPKPRLTSSSRKEDSSRVMFPHKTGNKRGGSNSLGHSDRKAAKLTSQSDRMPNCRICEGLGKPNEAHWHRECPNRQKAKEHISKLNSVIEQCSDSSDEETLPKSRISTSSDSSVPSELDEKPCTHSGKSSKEQPHSVNRVNAEPCGLATPSNSLVPFVHRVPQIFDAPLKTDTIFGTGNVFKTAGPVHVFLRGSRKGKDFKVCLDSGCGPTIGNRAAVTEVFPQACVQSRVGERLSVKSGFAGEAPETLTEYVSVTAYLATTKGNLLSIRLEIHLTDSVIDSGILVGASALKTNGLQLNFPKSILTTTDCIEGTKISVALHYDSSPEFIKTSAVRCTESTTIPPGHEAALKVDLSFLPKDRDFWFLGNQLVHDTRGVFVKSPDSFVNSTVSRVLMANFGESPYHVPADWIIGKVTEVPHKNFDATPSSLRYDRTAGEDFHQVRRA